MSSCYAREMPMPPHRNEVPSRPGIDIPITTLQDLAQTRDLSGCVALTFDDGPCEPWTSGILDILDEHGMPATFFVLGARAVGQRPILLRMARLGCTVAIHGWDHARMPGLTSAERGARLAGSRALIESAVAQFPRYVRPPYGDVTPAVLREIEAAGHTPVFWSVHARDWSMPGTGRIVADIAARLTDGAVILLHDGGGNRVGTVQALPAIIKAVRVSGLRPVALPPG